MNDVPSSHPLVSGNTEHSPLIRALRGDRPERPPVWFMRQAGRSLPEYRSARTGTTMLESCLIPELAAEITMQPVRRHGVDAAIFFSDIVIPLALAGVEVEIAPGRGPVFATPLRTASDIARARAEHTPERLLEAVEPIRQTIQLVTAELGDRPLIGFAGAPFTLAAYLVEGAPSRDHLRARGLMHADSDAWRSLLEWAADLSGAFLSAQVEAGASAVQLFDSWAGSLSAADYRERVAPASQRALEPVRNLRLPGAAETTAPTIHFAVGSGHLLEEFAELGTSAVGVDWRTPLDEASRRLGDRVTLQGNIDPAFLSTPEAVLRAHATDVIERGRRAPAHVVNLGHGVPPETDPAVLTGLVEWIHEH